MYRIKRTDAFAVWLDGLKDRMTRLRLIRRLEKADLGDIKLVGEGVYEMREHFGPGWRMYYVQHNDYLIVMLGGGSKSGQSSDIAKAQALAAALEN
jgi:putative addiction module killer protein